MNILILYFINVLTFIFFSVFVSLNMTTSVDNAIYNFISQYTSSELTSLAIFLSNLGSEYFIIAVCLITLLLNRFIKKSGVALTIIMLTSSLLNSLLKLSFKRIRPEDVERLVIATGYSFPSGHAMNNMAFYTAISVLLYSHMKSKIIKTVFIICFYFLAISIGLSRIYLGVHYASDVFAGFALGFLVPFFVFYLIGLYLQKDHNK